MEETESIGVSKGVRNHQGLDWVTVRKGHRQVTRVSALGVAALGTEGVHTLDSELRVVESVSDDASLGQGNVRHIGGAREVLVDVTGQGLLSRLNTWVGPSWLLGPQEKPLPCSAGPWQTPSTASFTLRCRFLSERE